MRGGGLAPSLVGVVSAPFGVASAPLQMLAPHADLVADEFIAELECIEPVGTDRAVSQPHDGSAQDRFELVLQAFELIERMGVLNALADIEDGGGKSLAFSGAILVIFA